jgi:hypothetical protein
MSSLLKTCPILIKTSGRQGLGNQFIGFPMKKAGFT